MKIYKKLTSLCLSVLMTFSCAFGTTGFISASAQEKNTTLKSQVLNELKKYNANDSNAKLTKKFGQNVVAGENSKKTTEGPEDIVRIVVKMKGQQDLTKNTSSINSIKSTINNAETNASKLEGAKIRHSYQKVLNGFSMDIKRKEIDKVKKLAGVDKVSIANVYYPDMNYAKNLTQAFSTWKDLGYKGEGMVVAVIDTGIDPSHKDMKLTDPSQAKIKTIASKSENPKYTSKVPYGYNFADQNDDTLDRTTGDGAMHGMHVSGIIGANGDPEEVKTNKAVQGVAPECQLLAMKVFSNDPKNSGAFSDDIIAAIDDSVKHGADVINMSLGSFSGFQSDTDPEQVAVENAVKAGTMVVCSSGNEQYSTAPYKFNNIVDDSVAGTPGIAKDALQVASYENTNSTLPALKYTVGDTTTLAAYMNTGKDPVTALTSSYDIVDCGYGNVSEFPANVAGKIALIERGNANFATKQTNAQNAGAVGAIIYNNQGDAYISMVKADGLTIPAIFISQTDGEKLKSLISSGVKISFGKDLASVKNANSGDMSDFSSWGPTPNLDFKPEITAPGGQIFSTVNNNNYETMNGTSMASPHVAGSEALILQAVNKAVSAGTLKFATPKDKILFAKNTTINTAEVLMDKAHPTVPYSPRRQGAGMIQIENAAKNSVLAIGDDGNADVSLKDFSGNTVTYNLNINNYGTQDATYTLGTNGGVLTGQKDSTTSMDYDIPVNGAKVIFDNSKVTVPAGSTKTVKVTIDLSNATVPTDNSYVEGFVTLTSDKDGSKLVSPFMGFHGDWAALQIVDAPRWDNDNTNYGITTLISGDNYFLGGNSYSIDPNKIAISPNGDGFYSDVKPLLGLLRNAKQIDVDILDSNKSVVRSLSQTTDFKKYVISKSNESALSDAIWDGKLFDSTSGKYVTAPDGQYYVRIKATADYPNAKAQELDMPVKIDTQKPTITVLSAKKTATGNYTLQFKASDSGSGLYSYDTLKSKGVSVVYVNWNAVDPSALTYDSSTDTYSCNLTLANGQNTITVEALDVAGNENDYKFAVTVGDAVTPFNVTFSNFTSGDQISTSTLVDGNYILKGSITTADVKNFKIAGTDVTINPDLTFSVPYKPVQGAGLIKVYAEDLDGNVLANYSLKVAYDGAAPELSVNAPYSKEDGKIYVNGSDVTLTGTFRDVDAGAKLLINGTQVASTGDDLNAYANFSYKLSNVTVGQTVEIKAVDGSINANTTVVKATIDHEKDKTAPTVTSNALTSTEDGFVVTYSENIKATGDLNGITLQNMKGKFVKVQASIADNKLAIKPLEKLEAGNSYTLNVPAGLISDASGNAITSESLKFATSAQKKNEYSRLAGSDRYATNAKIVDEGWTTSDVAVLVTGGDYPDALTASVLAKAYNAPILLTSSSTLSQDAATEIKNLKVKTVYIVGGTGAVSLNVENTLRDEYGVTVQRFAGKDRFETAVEVAKQVYAKLPAGSAKSAVVATGSDYPDALSIASIAAANQTPILLVQKDNVSDSVLKLIKDNGVDNVTVIGGAGVVSDDVLYKLPHATRLAGKDRYDTNYDVVNFYKDKLNLSTLYFATGSDYPDALSGSGIAALGNSPILLTAQDPSSDIENFMAGISSKVQVKYVLGGTGAVSDDVMQKILEK